MNITATQTTEIHAEQNPLYIRMRSRFDFSGNRTIGEFMMMKATREGYNPPAKTVSARKASTASRRPLISLAALLLSCMMLIIGAISFVNSVSPAVSEPDSAIGGVVHIGVHSDPETLGILFPADSGEVLIQE